MAAASTARSGVHLIEALALGTRAPTSPTPVAWGQVTATVPTAGANAPTSVTATITGAAVGDIIVSSVPTVALSHLGGNFATITAADTVTIVGIGDSTGFTGASKVYNYVLFKGA